MTLVVDASVVVKWFVKEELHEQSLWLTESGQHLGAPDFLIAEVTSIVWKKCLRGEITQLQAESIVAAIPQYIKVLQPSLQFAARALEIALALRHPVYDCFYLACAESLNDVLITADRRLCRALENTDFAHLARYLGDPDLSATVH